LSNRLQSRKIILCTGICCLYCSWFYTFKHRDKQQLKEASSICTR